jgi:hypothetical protein
MPLKQAKHFLMKHFELMLVISLLLGLSFILAFVPQMDADAHRSSHPCTFAFIRNFPLSSRNTAGYSTGPKRCDMT